MGGSGAGSTSLELRQWRRFHCGLRNFDLLAASGGGGGAIAATLVFLVTVMRSTGTEWLSSETFTIRDQVK